MMQIAETGHSVGWLTNMTPSGGREQDASRLAWTPRWQGDNTMQGMQSSSAAVLWPARPHLLSHTERNVAAQNGEAKLHVAALRAAAVDDVSAS